MLISQVLVLNGMKVTICGRSPSSLKLAEKLGLDTALVSTVDAMSCDIVVESTGNPDGLTHALRMAKPKGTVVMKSTYANPPTVDLTPIVVNGLKVVGSRCGPFSPAMRLLKCGQIQTEPLIDASYSLDDAIAAIEHASRPGVRKVLLQVS